MQYFGGKARIAKELTEYLKSVRKPSQPYVEPFVGAGWVIERMDGERYGYDKHPYIIHLLQALQNGWIPPKSVSEDEYYYAKKNQDENPPLSGFIGFGCSYSGRWFEGYARSGKRNYALNAYNSLMKKLPNLQEVHFECKDYQELTPENALVYCDPPYKGAKKYSGLEDFDTDVFWDKMREWSEHNTVLVSEYKAPADFICVWKRETKTDIRNGNNEQEDRVEKLFRWNGKKPVRRGKAAPIHTRARKTPSYYLPKGSL